MLAAPARLALYSAALVGLALAACTANNPNYCDAGEQCNAVDARLDGTVSRCNTSGPDPVCPADEPVCASDLCGGACAGDTDCATRTDGATVCLMPPGDCVACDENDAQAAPGSAEDECPTAAMAVCDGASHTCRPCEAHTECASGVCEAGTCVTGANVIYMKADGTDVNGCGDTPANGCLTLQVATNSLTASRKYIVMAPSPATFYTARAGSDRADFNNRTAHVIGYGAFLRRSDDGAVVEVRGNSSNVIIEGLTIERSTGATGVGITNSSVLELRRTIVRNNDRYGVESTAGTLRLVRSTLTDNRMGGVNVTGGTYLIVNNFIVDNGGNSSIFGGVNIGTNTPDNVFDFNTVAFNDSGTASTDGVSCAGGAHLARNNIIVGGSLKPRVAPGTTCVFTNTLYGPDGIVAGAGNTLVQNTDEIMFTSSTDFHLRAGSVATGKALATTLSAHTSLDIDGEPRAAGGATVEVGADEIP